MADLTELKETRTQIEQLNQLLKELPDHHKRQREEIHGYIRMAKEKEEQILKEIN